MTAQSKLDQLRAMTIVVADTGDIEAIARYRPEDATTNPSLLLKTAQSPHYQTLVAACVGNARLTTERERAQCCDQLAVTIGCEILQLIPGRVSTEVDARLSFDTQGTVERALQLIDRYAQAGIGPERILIKVAGTWEGIRAVAALEKRGINCNVTLLFNAVQALAAADAGAYLISPFVGRILDWHLANSSHQAHDPDPGVASVRDIYQLYKSRHYATVVMGASFRNTGQIEALAGCDRLTVSPALLEQLSADFGLLTRRLSGTPATTSDPFLVDSESDFRLRLNQDAMATEKLSEGIRLFIRDQESLELLLTTMANK